MEVKSRVWLSPMSGVSDLPFRRAASRLGARYVATEMVACEQFTLGRPDAVRRAAIGDGLPRMIVQLVGGDPKWVAAAARLARDAGADVIDLNFGCPAKEVTGIACGSALMRRPDLAERLTAAAVAAQDAPVTVKTRLGWDAGSRNAPELARRVEAAGAAAITVHGRTRSQFYTGRSDWAAVAEVKNAVRIPVIVNGDIVDGASARQALELSGADGVMIGRAAVGRPWVASEIEAYLAGEAFIAPRGEALADLVALHFHECLAFHGAALGLRMFRKHLAGYIQAAPTIATLETRREARARLCRLETPGEVRAAIDGLLRTATRRLAA